MKGPSTQFRKHTRPGKAGRAAWISLAVLASLASASPPTPAPVSGIWIEPRNLASRDLFLGPGGANLVPGPKTAFQFKGLDTKGHSDGYDVVDPSGRAWDVKIGDEAQSEVAASRILWAIGFHQPVVYYVPRWRMVGGPTASPEPGRFRLASDHKTLGEWSWKENPFVGTRPFRGLIIANLLLNNWDLDTSNNRVYGAGKGAPAQEKRYVVQDLGASLAKTAWPLGGRNDIDDFESQRLIRSVHSGRVEFDYHGRHRHLLQEISAADVVWICQLLNRLSDRQLDDAFRAAGYAAPIRDRYVRKLREKIQEGVALPVQQADLR